MTAAGAKAPPPPPPDLRLDALFVICPGSVRAPLAPGVEVVGIEAFAERPRGGV